MRTTQYVRNNLPHGMIDQLASGAEPRKPKGWVSRPETLALRKKIRAYVKDRHGNMLLRWLYGRELLKAKEKHTLSRPEWNAIIWRCNEIEAARQNTFGRPRRDPDQSSAPAKRDETPGKAGHLYAIEFSSGVLKVGRAMDPRQRLDYHVKVAAIHGNEIASQWVSDRHDGVIQTEAQLIRFCETRGVPVVGREYFRNLDFEQVCAFARSLAVDAYERGNST